MKLTEAATLLSLLVISGTSICDAFLPVTTTTSRRTSFGLTPQNSHQLSTRKQGLSRRQLALDDKEEGDDEYDEEDGDEPLAKGIDSVSWLPSVVGSKGTSDDTSDGQEILPLFPLGGIVYTPNSEHVLNIFEPRYRQMYTDILMNGSKRFVVSMSHPTEQGRFAQTGVLFELEDLKEVSEQTLDQIKYICNHKVTGRVEIDHIINPDAWENRDTYLRVAGTIIDDTGKLDKKVDEPVTNDVYGAVVAASQKSSGNTQEEKSLKEAFADLVEMQHNLKEDVRFTRASVESLAVLDGPGEEGLWQTIRLWQNYADQRLMARQNELQADFQEKLQKFLKKEKGLKEDELPSAIGFQDLSPALQKEVQELQKRMGVELQPLVLESTLTMQKILEAKDHTARCILLTHFINAERQRLSAKKTLQGMFSGDSESLSSIADASMPSVESLEESNEENTTKSSIFTDEPDAFQ